VHVTLWALITGNQVQNKTVAQPRNLRMVLDVSLNGWVKRALISMVMSASIEVTAKSYNIFNGLICNQSDLNSWLINKNGLSLKTLVDLNFP